ncbi:nitroreductase/quinone reductase family protein [Nocardia callitridis]|uniref:Nitroreductase family deazaflavin-dependent oxidoreductase n=1 Tax=Nocardia callitridis TaxID=648753 RepID=A0ABP9KFD1_9NOCA
MNTPDTTGRNDSEPDAPLSHLPDRIRRSIEITPTACTDERIINITTVARRTGRPRRIEIFFYRAAGATYLCGGAGGAATDWHANLLANPHFTFHLGNGIRADLPALATPVTDPTERHTVLAEIVADLNQPRPRHHPADPTRRLADSRLMRIMTRSR